ncbi:MAG: hypothetical protein PHC64_03510 [Candidatus Gastranaerophilales bacterium]|nr:hypothetical protein [Candidatus Gastranaerophilales bacterium]
MDKINKDLKYLILIWCIILASIFITYAHHGNILIDCGREVYYPQQILAGKILYKDLFNIYGPFAYMLNALLFKLFGINLNVLYLAGCVCSFLILTSVYLIAKRFLSKFLSFSIAVFTIAIGVFNLTLFNFIFPYSYAMLYGFVSFLISFLFLLKYLENSEKNFFLYLSCFFAGLCVINKYEFLPYLIPFIYAIFKIKPLRFKQYYFAFLYLLFMPIFCLGVLLLQDVTVNDLIKTALVIKKMMQTQTLKYFYLSQGVYFQSQTIPVLIKHFFLTVIPFGFFVWGFKLKSKFMSSFIMLLATVLIFYWTTPAVFVFLPLLILILSILSLKTLKENEKLALLVLSGILISLKTFWGLTTLNYGVFFVSFLLIALFALISQRFNNDSFFNQKAVGTYFIVLAIFIGLQGIFVLQEKNYPVKTLRGIIYYYRDIGSATGELIDYISKNTTKSDKIVIFPEGLLINFLTDRKSDDYYNSLIPLYVETFGEEKLVEHFEKTKPEYIIFNSWDTKDYYFHYICNDYAYSFCGFVDENYTQEKLIENGFRYLIFGYSNIFDKNIKK